MDTAGCLLPADSPFLPSHREYTPQGQNAKSSTCPPAWLSKGSMGPTQGWNEKEQDRSSAMEGECARAIFLL